MRQLPQEDCQQMSSVPKVGNRIPTWKGRAGLPTAKLLSAPTDGAFQEPQAAALSLESLPSGQGSLRTLPMPTGSLENPHVCQSPHLE